MKGVIKNKKKFWRTAVIFGFSAILISLFFGFSMAYAADIKFKPQIGFGDEFPAGKEITVTGNTIGLLIKAIYKYAIGAVGIIAAVAMMVGGLIWLTAGGDSGRVTTAKDIIKSSLLGMILLLCSFLILSTINPDLVKFRTLSIDKISEAKKTVTKICCGTSGPVAVFSSGECPSDSPACDKQCTYIDGKYQCKDSSSITCCQYHFLGSKILVAPDCSEVTTEICPATKGVFSLETTVKGKVCQPVWHGLGKACGDYAEPTEGCCLDANMWCQKTLQTECSNFKSTTCDKVEECKETQKGCCYFTDWKLSADCTNKVYTEAQCKAQGYNVKFKLNSHCGSPVIYENCCN
jgi:hypothetical protein